MSTFNLGDRVRRVGPHVVNLVFDGPTDYGDSECKVGDVGTVVIDWLDGDYNVRWDGSERASAIAGSSLELVEEAS